MTPLHAHDAVLVCVIDVQAAPRPRRFKETTNSKWDDYYEAESPPSYPHLQRISSARQGSYSDKALLLLSGTALTPSSHQKCSIRRGLLCISVPTTQRGAAGFSCLCSL